MSDVEETFFSSFEAKFTSFLFRAPLRVTFSLKEDKVILYRNSERIVAGNLETKEDSVHEHYFDRNLSVKENIFHIREWLTDNWYPAISEYRVEEQPLSASERLELVQRGVRPEVAILKKRHIHHTTRWTVFRVLGNKNCVFVQRRKEDGSLLKEMWDLNVPVSSFVRKIDNGQLSSAEAWDLIKDRVVRRAVEDHHEKGASE